MAARMVHPVQISLVFIVLRGEGENGEKETEKGLKDV